MNEEKAREILGDAITENDDIFSLGHYMAWSKGDDEIVIDAPISVEELLAIAWWIEHKNI